MSRSGRYPAARSPRCSISLYRRSRTRFRVSFEYLSSAPSRPVCRRTIYTADYIGSNGFALTNGCQIRTEYRAVLLRRLNLLNRNSTFAQFDRSSDRRYTERVSVTYAACITLLYRRAGRMAIQRLYRLHPPRCINGKHALYTRGPYIRPESPQVGPISLALH